ncbi:MAG: phospho-N-acetylmuramoyl-pentapeptide-transferase [Christensenellales bacterium]|jgi:phospho-N-acetylmuramoyl-pentapeptide-transferase
MEQAIGPILVSFFACLAAGPVLIPLLTKLKFGQVVRDDGPQSHLKKAGTPTIGGLIILVGVMTGTGVFLRSYDPNMLAAGICFLGFGIIGFLDDFLKIHKKRSLGLRAWQKIVLQLLVSIAVALYMYTHIGTTLRLPFTDRTWDLGVWYVPFAVLVLIATVNSANLTDGLDGLLSGVSLVYFAAYTLIFAALSSPLSDNMLVLCGALVGSCLGFLRFNVFPARVFMGDTGSLALGGAVAFVALASRTALWLPVMGGCYLISSLSDIIQVASYKLRDKKRVFKMAPIHHHFELMGMPETRVVAMYMIATTILCLAGLWAL